MTNRLSNTSIVIAAAVSAAVFTLALPSQAVSKTESIDDPVPLSFLALTATPEMSGSAPAPESPRHPIARMSVRATVTGYSADPAQTDDTPDITADGSRVSLGGIACPVRIPFGTRVLISGNEYVCNDRMAPRFQHADRFDIFFDSTAAAIHFGTVDERVEVLE